MTVCTNGTAGGPAWIGVARTGSAKYMMSSLELHLADGVRIELFRQFQLIYPLSSGNGLHL